MLRPGRYVLARTLSAVLVGLVTIAAAQDADDLGREDAAVRRFQTVLEKTPRRGTSLDRLYGYHVERGTLDGLVESYRKRADADAKDGASRMIVGLLEAQRGHDAAAVAAFREVEAVRPDDPLAPYYLGQTLVLIGRPDAAVEAFERALTRKPSRSDLLEIYQALGRVHQRARRADKALEVWARLETQFPDDPRVAEQIATTMAEEGQWAEALPRYEALAEQARDPYRRVQFRIESAELKVRLNRPKDALADLEGLLSGLNPESWLYNEVRRKVEEVFLRNDDTNGLASYYEAWLKAHPEDLDVIARQSRVLTNLGRTAEARAALDRAVTLAPTRRDLRLALVEQLVNERKFAEAALQYEALSKTDPNNPDHLREWGRLLLQDTSRPEAERRAAASAVWRRLLDSRPKDPAVAAQVADLFRRAEMPDDALALYLKAVELAPEAPQYREYLGEYYHALNRTEDALSAWSAMAAGANRNAANLGRLAEVLSGFGYKGEAERASAEAVALDPTSLDLRLKHAELLSGLDRFADALAELEAAAPLAADAESAEAVLEAEVRALQASGKLAERIAVLKGDLDAGRDGATADGWRRLARLYEAAGQLADANTAITRALEVDPKAVPSWQAAARIAESSGNFGSAADSYRKLAEIDRRARTEHLTAIARLEARLGRREAALAAGRDLLAAAPNNPEHHGFFAELCFGLGENDEGLKALRRAAQLDGADPQAAITLAEALARQFRTDEAIEIYWQAFDKATELDGKVGVVAQLAPLYLQQNAFDRLLARLERSFGLDAAGGDAEAAPREKAACLAQAYASSGDFAAARSQLEGLLAADSRDTQLLGQLSKLAEEEGDLASAAGYQKQIVDAAPSFESKVRLAQMYLRSGDWAASEAVWASLAADEEEASRVLQAVDSLLEADKNEAVLAITERLLRREPGAWDALYREGVALAGLERVEDAARRFRAIPALRGDDDEPDQITQARTRAAGKRQAGARPAQTTASLMYGPTPPIRSRTSAALMARRQLGLDHQMVSTGNAWTPTDFGMARMAALGWLLDLSQKADTKEALIKEIRDAAEAETADARARWDWFYLTLMQNQSVDAFDAARRLARSAPTDLASNWALLFTLPSCRPGAGTVGYSGGEIRSRGGTGPDRTPPLPAATLDEVLSAYRAVQDREAGWVNSVQLGALVTELKRAERKEDLNRIINDAITAASDIPSCLSALSLLKERGDVDAFLAVLKRIEQIAGTLSASQTPYLEQSVGSSTSDFVQALGDQKRQADMLRVVDAVLDASRQPDRVARRKKGQSATAASGGVSGSNVVALGRLYAIVRQGTMMRQVVIDFPAPNAYLDGQTIVILRGVYEAFRRDDLASDLVTHLSDRLAAQAPEDSIHERMALAAIRWWDDEQEEAMADWEAAVAATGKDPDLVLSLAEIRASRNEPVEALALADSIEPTDQRQVQRRELLALRLAVINGDVDRAQRAAERLFGLRLDSNTQILLASQMHQLGMHELAEAVLARARRRAGADSNALVALMLQYQRQEKLDQAIQVAHQILRKAPQAYRTNSIALTVTDSAQRQALQLLAQSGKLDELIARAEAQVARSPGSVGVYQSLAAYYSAAGQRDKVKEVAKRLVALRPDDARLRVSLAQQSTSSGDWNDAVEHFRIVLQKEPSLFSQHSYEVLRAYQQIGKLDDFYKLVSELDIRTLGGTSPYGMINVVRQLMRDAKSRDLGLDLFRKVWKAYPKYRHSILVDIISNNQIEIPEIYGYLQEAILPADSSAPPSPWAAVESITSQQGNGRVDSPVLRLLDLAAKEGRLKALGDDLDAALKRHSDWPAGRAIRALVQLRLGETAEGSATLRAMIENKDDPIPDQAVLVIGQELDANPAVLPLAITLYEQAVTGPQSSGAYLNGFEFTPAYRLVEAYQRVGHPERARPVILQHGGGDMRGLPDPGYLAYRRLSSTVSQGQMLVRLGYPADAARLYSEVLADGASIQLARNVGGTTVDRLTLQLRSSLEQAAQAIQGESVAQSIRGLLHPEGVAPPYGQALDLVLIVQSRDDRKEHVTSLLATALLDRANPPQLIAEATQTLDALANAHPDDFSVAIAGAAAALAGGEDEAIRKALSRLTTLVEATPLEPLAPQDRPNSRQRAEAARQMGLWTIARECARREPLQSAAAPLAARAQEAARRQTESVWIQAMLRESGELALARGDRPAAEAAWTELLTRIQAPAAARTASTANATSAPVSVTPLAPAAAPGATITPVRTPGAVTAVGMTPERVQQAGEIARLAAENGFVDLSLRAVAEALRGGPPVAPIEATNSRQALQTMVVSGLGMTSDALPTSNVANVATLIEILDPLWARSNADPAAVAATLAEVVAPVSRPKEVFLYPRPMSPALAEDPRSVAAIAVRWAVKAGTAEELRSRVDARRASPLAELPAHVLLAHLAIAQDDQAAARAALEALAARLDKDSLTTTADTACHAALPALGVAGIADAAEAVLSRAARSLLAAPSGLVSLGGDLALRLARHYHDTNRPAEARALLDSYQTQLIRIRSGSMEQRGLSEYLTGRVLAEYVRAGLLAEAMTTLGGHLDTAPVSGSDLPLGATSTLLARLIADQPARERYEQLRAWTLPAEGRRSVRSFTVGVSEATKGAPDRLLATTRLLVEAAREAGQLDGLAMETERAAAESIDGAGHLLAMVRIAQGRFDDARPMLAEATTRRLVPARPTIGVNNRPAPSHASPWPDTLLVLAALESPALREDGRSLAEAMLRNRNVAGVPAEMLHLSLTNDTARQHHAAPPRNTDLAHWLVAPSPSISVRVAGYGAGRWASADGHIRRLAGSQSEALVLAYPLAGTFAIEVDSLNGPDGRGGRIGFGGWTLDASTAQRYSYDPTRREYRNTTGPRLASPGNQEAFDHGPVGAVYDAFNTVRIEVEAGTVRYKINGRLIDEQAATPAVAPWLSLHSGGPSEFRRVRIEGKPEIPREVRLLADDDLRGWQGTYYNETVQPRAAVASQMPPRTEAFVGDPSFASGTIPFDWAARDGVLTGARRETPSTIVSPFQRMNTDPTPGDGRVPSLLTYMRPLREGETLTYEFLCDPGVSEIHPALGRFAYLIGPKGVRVHALTGPAMSDAKVHAPADAGPIPLRAGDWNRLALRLTADQMILSLNDKVVFERPLAPEEDRTFGLFHFKNQTTGTVREVALRGDWPETLPADVLAPVIPGTERVRIALLGEESFGRDASLVLEETRAMPADRRVEALAAWVLPTADRPAFRVQGTFRSGLLDVPALAMVEAAREAGQLDGLAERIESLKPERADEVRGKQALLVAVNAARGQPGATAAALDVLRPLASALPTIAPLSDRWPELIATAAALRFGADRAAIRPLSELLDDQARRLVEAESAAADTVGSSASAPRVAPGTPASSRPTTYRQAWAAWTARLRAELDDPAAADLRPPPALWLADPQDTAIAQAFGLPAATWVAHGDRLIRRPGQGGGLYLGLPLRGDFTLTGTLGGLGEAQVRPTYAGVSVAVAADGKTATVHAPGRNPRTVSLNPPIDAASGPFPFRLAVAGGTVRFDVAGRTVVEEPLPADFEPVLVLLPPLGGRGEVSVLALSGQPDIPESLPLAERFDLSGWHEFDPGMSGWQKRGTEIVAVRNEDRQEADRERILLLDRPIRAGESLSYEFYFEPGRSVVHPVLGHQVFLIGNDAIRSRARDGEGLPARLAGETGSEARPSGPLPLKERDWNRMTLALGDKTLTLTLNGVTVAEQPFDASGEHVFGLLSTFDSRDARVRQPTLSGPWEAKRKEWIQDQ